MVIHPNFPEKSGVIESDIKMKIAARKPSGEKLEVSAIDPAMRLLRSVVR